MAHSKSDVFRDMADYSESMKERLAQARLAGLDAIMELEAGRGIDLMLSYRAVKVGAG